MVIRMKEVPGANFEGKIGLHEFYLIRAVYFHNYASSFSCIQSHIRKTLFVGISILKAGKYLG